MNLKSRRILILVGLLAFVISCASRNAPPEIKPDLQRLEILHRVQELQRTVISIHDAAPDKLPKPLADTVVKFTLLANDLVTEAKPDWQSNLKSAWVALKKVFIPPPSLSTVWAIIDSLITGLI